MYGEQDCSGLLIRIFGAAGIAAPRNSSQQGHTGTAIYSRNVDDEAFDIRSILSSEGIAGATAVNFPGHIMLYIGNVAGEPYVLHAIWSFEEVLGDKFVAKRIPARVVVSPLGLSTHMEKGPYYERVTNIRIFK
jgi:cell wall-associated NlpC family hydrolase